MDVRKRMKIIPCLLFIGLITSLVMLSSCAKSHTRFTVLGFDMIIEDDPEEDLL